MDRIITEVAEVQKQIDRYQRGNELGDDETILELLTIAAERLLAEVVYFKAQRTAKEKIARIKIANEIRAKKEREG